MTDEITEPTLKLCWNGHAIRRAVELLRAAHLDRMADDIEAQILKPAVEEPTEFGSVVLAGIDGISDRVLWLRSASHYWFSETSRRADFSDFHHPEVVRVGVGEIPSESQKTAQDDAYLQGFTDVAMKVRRDLIQLKSSAVLSLEKRAYDKVLATVAALLGES